MSRVEPPMSWALGPERSSPSVGRAESASRGFAHRLLARRFLPVGLGAAGLVGAGLLQLRDPHVAGSWGLCPLRTLTGLSCPLCGGLRATHDLGEGHLVDAWFSNALYVGLLPALVIVFGWWTVTSLRGSPPPSSAPWMRRAVIPLLAFATVAFTVFRNTPWGSDYWA